MMNQLVVASRDLLAGALFLVLVVSTDAAVWTDGRGRSFEGDLVRLDGEQVVFALADGKEYALGMKQLSLKDQLKLRLLQPQSEHGRPLAPMSAWRADNGGAKVSSPVADTAAAAATPDPVQNLQKPLNFGYAWPMHTRYEGGSNVKVISENKDQKKFVYESPNFRFICDVKLNLDVLRHFSVLFETTHKYVRALPLAVDGGSMRDRRLEVLLYETTAGYYAAGGGAGTAACYVPASGVVMVPLASLGVKRLNNSFSMDMKSNNKVLVHELAHQLSPKSYMRPVLRNGWFIEGFAEYVSTTPYSWGYFQSDPQGNAALAYVTGRGDDGTVGRGLGKSIQMPGLKRLFNMSYREFSSGNGNLHYGVSLLLVHYYLHMEGNRDGRRMIQYLKGLRAGKTNKEAIEPLLVGGSYESLEKDFANAWAKKGIKIEFQP